MNKIDYDIWLSSINGIGPATFEYLINCFKTSENIWNSNIKDFTNININKKILDKILDTNYKNTILSEINFLYKNNIQIITQDSLIYPNELKLIKRPPKILYLLGNQNILNTFSLAIVGSRYHSLYGANIAQKFAFDLSKSGITIVSGLAKGIDSYSHKGTLLANGNTIAILPCGFNKICPKDNIKLFNQILENNGATLTEYLPNMPAIRGNFLARNRIISGITKGTLIIEANKKSGALTTANFTLEQNKKLFCIPSNIDNNFNQGGNNLIKNGAKVVTNINDILNEFDNLKQKNLLSNNISNNSKTTNNIQSTIINLLSSEPVHIEIISKALRLDISKINSSLTLLELQGIIKRLPGNNFILKE